MVLVSSKVLFLLYHNTKLCLDLKEILIMNQQHYTETLLVTAWDRPHINFQVLYDTLYLKNISHILYTSLLLVEAFETPNQIFLFLIHIFLKIQKHDGTQSRIHSPSQYINKALFLQLFRTPHHWSKLLIAFAEYKKLIILRNTFLRIFHRLESTSQSLIQNDLVHLNPNIISNKASWSLRKKGMSWLL